MRLRPFVLAALPLFACTDNGGFTKLVPRLVITPQSLDFAEVPLHATRFMTVRVVNAGAAPLTLMEVATWAPYTVDPLATSTLQPGQELELTVGYAPRDLVEAGGMLVVTSDDPDRPEVTIAFSGRGISGDLEARPAKIDFSSTALATVRSLQILLTNHGQAPKDATITTHRFARPEHFSLFNAPGLTAGGTVMIPATGSVGVPFDYHPYASGPDLGRVLFETCGPNCGLAVEVDASALYDGVRLDPPALDFGSVGIGTKKRLELSIENDGDQNVVLQSAQITGTDLVVVIPAGELPRTIGPHSRTSLGLDFGPTSADELEGMLLISVGGDERTLLRTVLSGRGEGSRLVVSPGVIDFGAQHRPGPSRRTALMENAGSAPVRILSIGVRGDPAFHIVAGGPGFPIQLAPGESTYAEIELDPAAQGTFEGTLEVTSDGEVSEHQVPMHGSYQARECDLEVLTPQLNFGLIVPGGQRTMTFTAINRGVGPCTLIAGERVTPFDPGYSFTEPVFPIRVEAGASLTIDFQYTAAILGPAKLSYRMVTDEVPAFAYKVALFALGGDACDGTTPNCFCPVNQTPVYHRYDGSVPSGISAPEDKPPYRTLCEPTDCRIDEVSVETAPGVFTCAATPPVCADGTGLAYSETGWRCIPCDIVVQYGFIYFGLRICAPPPPTTPCPAGQVQTFIVEAEAWQCATTCDNGLYDQINYAGALVCVPC